MNLYLDYFPTELVSKLKSPKSSVKPVLEIPEFPQNLASLYALISEFFMFVVRENSSPDIHLNEFSYGVDIPFNPLDYWTKKYPKLDLEKYAWLSHWRKFDNSDVEKFRELLLETLSNNSLLSIERNESKKLYRISFSKYPQAEGLLEIHRNIENLVDDLGVDLFGSNLPYDHETTLPLFLTRKGLLDLGYYVYTITYTFGSDIVLNNRYLISKLNYSSPNDLFFEYVYQNPKKKLTRSHLEALQGQLDRPLSKYVYDIGFKGELKKLFFPKVSNNSIFFNNPVTREDLLKLDIDENALLEQVNGLKTIHFDTE